MTLDEIQLALTLARGERNVLHAGLPRFIVALAKLRPHSVSPFQELAAEHPHFPIVQEYADLLARINTLEIERDTQLAAAKPPPDLTLRSTRPWHGSGKESKR